MYKFIPENLVGNDYAVGDIHGMYTLLYSELVSLGFDFEKDRLFSVGDLVDRGPESARVINYLSKPWFIPVRGNHEDLTILAYSGDHMHVSNHYRNGGVWFEEIPEQEKKAIVDGFKKLPIMIETVVDGKSVGFVHGDIVDWDVSRSTIEKLTLEQSMMETTCIRLQWGRSRVQKQLTRDCKGIDHVFLGHTPLQKIKTLSNCSFIDTGACFGGKLSIINIKDFLNGLLNDK